MEWNQGSRSSRSFSERNNKTQKSNRKRVLFKASIQLKRASCNNYL